MQIIFDGGNEEYRPTDFVQNFVARVILSAPASLDLTNGTISRNLDYFFQWIVRSDKLIVLNYPLITSNYPLKKARFPIRVIRANSRAKRAAMHSNRRAKKKASNR